MSTTSQPADVITVAGHDLVDDLIGRRSFTGMIHLLLTGGAEPDPAHVEMIDALLVTFTDHGVTPSSMAARLTLLGAPEALQAAVAAGLCGAGSRFLGTLENAASDLAEALRDVPEGADLGPVADELVATARAGRTPVVGIGHPEHKNGDPRVPRLVELADSLGVRGRHTDLLLELPAALVRAGGPLLPANAAGLAGALIADMGYGPAFARGIAVISRAAGLVGQLLDEERAPVARRMWDRERTDPIKPLGTESENT
jgi:citrate synthase